MARRKKSNNGGSFLLGLITPWLIYWAFAGSAYLKQRADLADLPITNEEAYQ